RSPQVWRQGSSGILGTPQQGDRFGQSLSAWNFGQDELAFVGGQITNLKAADLAVGVPFKKVGTAAEAGAVVVIYGSHVTRNNGLVSTSSQFWTQNSPGMPGSSDPGDHFGASLY